MVLTPLPTLLSIHPVLAGSGKLSAPVSGVVTGAFVVLTNVCVTGPRGTSTLIALRLLEIAPFTSLSPGTTMATGLGKNVLTSTRVPGGTLSISGVTLLPPVIRITSGPLSGCFPVPQTPVIVVLPKVLVLSLQIALAGKVISLLFVTTPFVEVTPLLAGPKNPAPTPTTP